jgi:urea transport system substrate-binding protein
MTAAGEYRIALVIPRSGSPGLYGPSCRSCVELAVEEINTSGGFEGSRVALTLVDGAQRPQAVTNAISALLDSNSISAIVGMHDSDIRQAIIETTCGQVPYIYAANYEGDGSAEGVVSLGLTAAQQIHGSINWLESNRNVRDWLFIGNDYVWPRSVERTLAAALDEAGLKMLASEFVGLGETNYAPLLNVIEQTRPDAVFAALVGADAVAFCRQFVRRGLDRFTSRFLPLFEENSLLAVGNAIGCGAYTSGSFFAGHGNAAERAFEKRYDHKFGSHAPQLNAFAVACYEATKLLPLLNRAHISGGAWTKYPALENLKFEAARGVGRIHGSHAVRDVFLMEAVSSKFELRAQFDAVEPDGRLASFGNANPG